MRGKSGKKRQGRARATRTSASRRAMPMERHSRTYMTLGILLAGGSGSAWTAHAAASFPPIIELATLDGTDGFVLEGIEHKDYAGIDVIGAGDINGDGIDDLLIGAHKADNGPGGNAGEVYVVFGARSSGPAARWSYPAWTGRTASSSRVKASRRLRAVRSIAVISTEISGWT
jgi:hypothetical protein